METFSKREQIRNLVKEFFLDFRNTEQVAVSKASRTVIVNSLKTAARREFDRDESSKA